MPRRCRRLTELGIAADLSNERSDGACVLQGRRKLQDDQADVASLPKAGASLSVRHKKTPVRMSEAFLNANQCSGRINWPRVSNMSGRFVADGTNIAALQHFS